MSEPRVSLKRRFKNALKPAYLRTRHLYAQTFFSYGPDGLGEGLGHMGLELGDSVLVHSAFTRDNGFSGGAVDVIDVLLETVGPQGHLLMMSMPYVGSSEAYAESGIAFDVSRTPSALGLISEVFRRRDEVLRSRNPLHPVLAHGPKAAWLTADHEKLCHSCGRGSPFERFLSINGKVLFLDVSFENLTFMHYAEDYFQDKLPVPLYAENKVNVQVIDPCGSVRNISQFVFGTEAREKRNFLRVERRLDEKGLLKRHRVGNSQLLLVATQDVFNCARDLIEEGSGFYDN